MGQSSRTLALGLVWAVTAILIWSGSLVMLRLGVTTGLTAYDLTMLRFGVAAAILGPLALRRGSGWGHLGPAGAAVLVAAFGAPYVLLIAMGLETVPAAGAGALNPGIMAVTAVLLGRGVFGDRLGGPRVAGMACTVAGIALFVGPGAAVTPGHLILIGTGVMWAVYTLVVRGAAVPALTATTVVAVGSALAYGPVYLLALPKQIGVAPLGDLLLQVVFQGVLVSVVAIYAFTRSAELLGPVAGATLPALIPVVTLLLGHLLLGEAIGPQAMASAGLVTFGLALILVGRPLGDRLWQAVRRSRLRD